MAIADIPMNALGRHVAPLQDALRAAAAQVIGSGHFVLGPGVAEFEAAFARYCGVAHAIGVGNGTDALELGLKALGVTPGDQVAVTANAAMYASTAVLSAGATPVFVDVLEDATMDPAALERMLQAQPGIRAVVATHLYGRLAHMPDILAACRPRGIRVLEDCAQAHGARDPRGHRAGALADIASFSFYPTKNLGAIGDGGAVTCDDPLLETRVRQLRQYGWTSKYSNGIEGGRNSRLDEIQARMLLAMLPSLDGWNDRRREIANRYSAQITNPRIRVPAPAGAADVAHLYVIQCDDRDALREHLAGEAVQTDVHYPIPDHRQACFDGRYASVSLPVTERQALAVLSLPCFPELTDAECARVIDACNRF